MEVLLAVLIHWWDAFTRRVGHPRPVASRPDSRRQACFAPACVPPKPPRPDAASASCWETPETAAGASVTKFSPIPKPNNSIGPRTPPTYELSELMSACQASPIAASAEPRSMNGFGPSTDRNRCERPARSAITTVTGRKASPHRSG